MVKPLLDANFIASTLGPVLHKQSGPDKRFARAVVDSREVKPGDLFVALPGRHTDGHDFVADAIERGASGLLLERIAAAELPHDTAVFLVRDALQGLQLTATAWRAALSEIDVVGITGSVGKTTTKLMATSVLERTYRVRSSELNYNNEIGVPLCLLELDHTIQRTVIEHGMYTRGEITQLCSWTNPRIGVVLNVGPVHIQRAGSLEAIALAKRELVEALPSDGHAVLNLDDPIVAEMAQYTTAQICHFGSGADADVRGTEVKSAGASGFTFMLEAYGERSRVKTSLPGTHLLLNVLAAASVGLIDGVPFQEVVSSLETLEIPLRLTIRRLPGGITLLDDTYNASPAATLAALDLLAALPGRKLALLGDMLELGGLAGPSHAAVGRRAAEVVDTLFTVGDLARSIAVAASDAGLDSARHLASKDEAARTLREALRPGDALLVKGSRALALETVVAHLESELACAGGAAPR